MNEEEMKMELEMRRRETRARQQVARTPTVTRARINFIEAGLILGFVIGVDLLDYFIIGDLPIVGDVIDLAAGGTIWFWIKIKGLDQGRSPLLAWGPWIATGIELIPFIGDLPPSFTIDVLIIMVTNTEVGRRAARIISPI